jgi:hypothetical protein
MEAIGCFAIIGNDRSLDGPAARFEQYASSGRNRQACAIAVAAITPTARRVPGWHEIAKVPENDNHAGEVLA